MGELQNNDAIQLFEDRKSVPRGMKNRKNGIFPLWM